MPEYFKTLRSVDARWKILVVDEYTHKMLFSVFTTYDVLDTGIQRAPPGHLLEPSSGSLTPPRRTEIDIITNKRSPQHHLPAIYLLMPTSQNVDLVLRDYSPAPPPQQSGRSKKDKHQPSTPPVDNSPKYAAAHLHFVDGAHVCRVPRQLQPRAR